MSCRWLVFGLSGLLCATTSFLEAQPIEPTGTSNAAREFLETWAASFQDVRSLRVRFVQKKELRILRKPRISKGVTLLKGKRVLMRIFDRDDEIETELLVADGEARIYSPRHRRIEVYKVGKGKQRRSPFPLLREDVEALPEEYHLQLTGEGGDDILVLRPREEDAEFVLVRLTMRQGRLVVVEQENRRGDRVTLEITEFTRNPEIADAELELSAPKDVEVVRMFE